MSRKTAFWCILGLYVAASGVTLYYIYRGRHLRTLPLLESMEVVVPTLRAMQREYGAARAPAYLNAARQALIERGRVRLKEAIEGVGDADAALTGDMLVALEERGIPRISVWDTRQIIEFCRAHLILAESLKGPDGALLISDGKPIERELLFRYLRAHGLTLENVTGGSVQPQRKLMKGRGSIVGLNATMFMVGVNFAVLVALLYLVLWRPLTRLLDERAEAIRHNIDTAEDRHRQAEALLEQRQQELRAAHDEREALRRKGQHEGQEERVRLIQQARAEAVRIQARTQEETEAAVLAAREALVSELGRHTLALASRLLEREVDEGKHRELVRLFMDSLAAEKPLEPEKQ